MQVVKDGFPTTRRMSPLLKGGCVLGGVLALALAAPENAHAFASVRFAIKEICGHIQGNLGGLLMTTAGVGALVAAAFGNMRATHSMIVAGIGAATVSALLSLYFSAAANECKGEGSTPGSGLERQFNEGFTVPNERAPLNNAGIDAAALNAALNRQVDFSGAATLATDDDESETAAAPFDRDFVQDAEDF